MSLHEQAMLVNLNISMWDARKFDRAATTDVEAKHGAKDAGRFNKLLIDKAALEPIAKVVSASRAHHYKLTLPWGDNGDRLLPSKLYLQYTQDMRGFKGQLAKAADKFAEAYPGLVQDARKRLGTLYNPGDYPTVQEARRRFGMELSFTPVPDAKDFRVDVAAEDAETIRADIVRITDERRKAAVKDMFERAREMVTRVHERLTSEKPVIRDTLMTNLEELITLVRAFNTDADPELQQLEAELRGLIRSPNQLRVQALTRKTVADAANDIMARMKWA